MKQPTGKFRKPGAGGQPATAYVAEVGFGLEVPEEIYRARQYLPPFEQLPWQDSADAR